jgi:ATP/maltotriose-dependent transcriptional regulator MalT
VATVPSSDHRVSLEAGNEALARRDWPAARAVFDALVTTGPRPEALEGQSWAAWYQNDAETVFTARERAYHLYREAGDYLGAARMAIWLGNDYFDFRGDTAISNGWLQTAQRLLDELPTASEHGWLAIVQGDMAVVLAEDTVAARAHAQRAVAIGRQLRDHEVEVLGRAVEGLALVIEGDLQQGMSLMDEAATEAISGGVPDAASVSFVLCHLLYACERSQDFERATQWCERTREYTDRIGFHFAQGSCRVHYASLLLWQGMWAEAEQELSDAGRFFRLSRPAWEVEARVHLGELRRRQGRLDEAEALFRDSDFHPMALLGLAEIDLVARRFQDAEEAALRILRMIPARSLTARAAACDLLVRVHAAAGDHPRAIEALAGFDAIAETVGTLPLRSAGRLLAGLVAEAASDDHAARSHFEDALIMFERAGAPYEAARTRLALAGLFLREGRRERAQRDASTALAALTSLGAAGDAAQAQALLEGSPTPSTGPLTDRQVEVLRLVSQGMSDREIAAALVMSEHTVHRHVANILQRLGEPSRAAAVAHASRLGLL